MGLVFSISNCFINKSALANKWMSISCSNSALLTLFFVRKLHPFTGNGNAERCFEKLVKMAWYFFFFSGMFVETPYKRRTRPTSFLGLTGMRHILLIFTWEYVLAKNCQKQPLCLTLTRALRIYIFSPGMFVETSNKRRARQTSFLDLTGMRPWLLERPLWLRKRFVSVFCLETEQCAGQTFFA